MVLHEGQFSALTYGTETVVWREKEYKNEGEVESWNVDMFVYLIVSVCT